MTTYYFHSIKIGTLRITLTLLSVFCYLSVQSQITFERNYDYGFAEVANDVIQTSDGGYLMAGRQGINLGQIQTLLVKTDEHGDVEWTSTVWEGYTENYPYAIVEVDDSLGYGFVMTGKNGRPGEAANVMLARLTETGDSLWTKSFDSGGGSDTGFDLISIPDSGYVISCIWSDTLGSVIRTDLNGEIEWITEVLPAGADGAQLEGIELLDDGGFATCGTVHYPDPAVLNDMLIVRLTQQGDTVWTTHVGAGSNDLGRSIKQDQEGFLISAGSTWQTGLGDFDFYAARLSISGDTVWTKYFGTEFEDGATDVCIAGDNGYVMVGGGDLNGSNGTYEVQMIKVNSNGEQQWQRFFGPEPQESDIPYAIVSTDDGGFAATGLTNSFGTIADYHLVKTNDQGLINAIEPEIEQTEWLVYPIPSNGVIHIKPSQNHHGIETLIRIYSTLGSLVHEEQMKDQASIDLSRLTNGTYHIQMITNKSIHTTTCIINH